MAPERCSPLWQSGDRVYSHVSAMIVLVLVTGIAVIPCCEVPALVRTLNVLVRLRSPVVLSEHRKQ